MAIVHEPRRLLLDRYQLSINDSSVTVPGGFIRADINDAFASSDFGAQTNQRALFWGICILLMHAEEFGVSLFKLTQSSRCVGLP
jgi:hypothetical protein